VGERRFVVLEHHWNGVHWDLMVEVGPDGPLRTWAIDAEPVPGRDLPARALADHRRDYLTYEGPVSGGRGEVRRWDEGTCAVEVWQANLVRLVLRGAHLIGPVELWGSTAGGEGEFPGMTSASGAGGSSSGWLVRFGKLARRV
jgi:hypothetical protein